MKKLDFIFFDAGGGHRSAANALRQVMEQQGRAFEIRMVNLQELLDSKDISRKLTGLRLQDVYNVFLKNGWTLGSGTLNVTILADIADYPPHFWTERQDQHVIRGSDKAVEHAHGMGNPPAKVHQVPLSAFRTLGWPVTALYCGEAVNPRHERPNWIAKATGSHPG